MILVLIVILVVLVVIAFKCSRIARALAILCEQLENINQRQSLDDVYQQAYSDPHNKKV